MYQVGQNPLKDVDPRVFTKIVTDGSVTISPCHFVGEGIIILQRGKRQCIYCTLEIMYVKCHFQHYFSYIEGPSWLLVVIIW